ncbi:hypothetical protein ACP70R_025773 [Stipagrostis hirtigluma subsp. patula]
MRLQILRASCYKEKTLPRMFHETKRCRFSGMPSPVQMNMAASLRGLVLLLAVSVSLRRSGAAVTVEQACQQTKFPEFCVKSLSSAPPELKPAAELGGLPAMAELSMALAAKSGAETVAFVKNLEKIPGGMPPECLEECVGKFTAAVGELRRSKVALDEAKDVGGVKTWVMAAKTDGDTCLAGCNKVEGGADPNVRDKIGELDMLCSIAMSLNDASLRNPAPSP